MKPTPGFTDEEREAYWTKIIIEARRSPLGVTRYLEKKKIEKSNYYKWFQKLRPSHPEWTDLAKDPKYHAMKTRAKRREKLPKTEVAEKAKRRRFSPQEKMRILNEVDNGSPGQTAAILRREGIYSSQLSQFRAERDANSLEAKKRGRKPNPATQEVKLLKAKLARSERKLAQANALLDLQKKVSEILKTLDVNSDED